MKKLYLILLLILILPIATADEIVLEKGKSKLYKIYPLELVSIGTSGSVHIKINQVDKVIQYGSSEEIYGLKVTLLESHIDTQTAKIDIEQTAECLIDADCNDDTACTKDICELRECKHEEQIGCPFNNQCRPEGSLSVVDSALSYCDGTSWHPRKQYKESCTENYECLTNYCDNYCKALGYLRGGGKMAPAWILIIIGIIIGIEGLLCLISPKYAKRIYINLLKLMSKKAYRIAGLIGIIIAAALIIWALI